MQKPTKQTKPVCSECEGSTCEIENNIDPTTLILKKSCFNCYYETDEKKKQREEPCKSCCVEKGKSFKNWKKP